MHGRQPAPAPVAMAGLSESDTVAHGSIGWNSQQRRVPFFTLSSLLFSQW